MNPLRLACATALVGGLAVLVAACGGGSAALPTPTASPTPAPTPAPPTPTPTPTPPPPSVELTVAHPRQGGFVVVRLEQQPPGTQEATAVLAGESYQMAPDGDGWLGVIGLATDLPAGDYTLEVLADGSGVGSAPVSVTEGGFERAAIDGALHPEAVGDGPLHRPKPLPRPQPLRRERGVRLRHQPPLLLDRHLVR